MTKIHQIADFSGQTIHVGMDVHLKQWNITLYNNQQYLRKFQQESNPETLIKHMKLDFVDFGYNVPLQRLVWNVLLLMQQMFLKPTKVCVQKMTLRILNE
jgi:hypothetical protein